MIGPLVVVTGETLDPVAFAARLDLRDAGAVTTFTGLCRSEDGRLEALELEHYPLMAERKLREIADEAVRRFGLLAMGVAHRFGVVPVGDPIVAVVAASRHRQASFDGASFVMDYLKTDAPFWKKEHGVDGTEGGWVSAADKDDAARDRWKR